MIFFRNSKLRAVTTTINLLAGYHAVKSTDPLFVKKYNHLLSLQKLLKGK